MRHRSIGCPRKATEGSRCGGKRNVYSAHKAYSFNENTHSQHWWQMPLTFAAKSAAALSPNHPLKRSTSWPRSRVQRGRLTVNPRRFRTYDSVKERLTLQTGPEWTRQHDTEGKRHLHPLLALLLCRRNHFTKGRSHNECEVWKELAARTTELADSSLSSTFREQVLLKKSW